MASNKYRQFFIETFIARLYENEKVNYLFDESLEELQKKAVDKYLNTNLTYDEIADDIMKVVQELRRRKENTEEKTEAIKDNNELEEMVEESTEVKQEVINIESMEKPKQFVKTDNNKDTQSGSVSIFGIVIAILSIIGFILFAMILNVLLK